MRVYIPCAEHDHQWVLESVGSTTGQQSLRCVKCGVAKTVYPYAPGGSKEPESVALESARYFAVPAQVDSAIDQAWRESVKQDAEDAARYRFLCKNPDWKFIEDICRSFVGESEATFYQGLSLAIDARRHKCTRCEYIGHCDCEGSTSHEPVVYYGGSKEPIPIRFECDEHTATLMGMEFAKHEKQKRSETQQLEELFGCDHYPEGFDASVGLPAWAMQNANMTAASLTGSRSWDVPCIAQVIYDTACAILATMNSSNGGKA